MILKKINWNTIYQNQSPELMKLCLRYVQDKSQAEDLMHDAFLTAIDKIDTYKNIGSFNGWLKKIVLNTVLQHLRQNKKLEISQEYDDNIMQKSNQADAVVNKKYIIAQADFSKEEIIETLETLPAHNKTVFNLYVFEGYKHEQISKMLEISVGTSKSCLSRARKKLIELLYSKADEQVKEEKKKRKVLAVLLVFPLGDGFIDKVYKRGFQAIYVNPKQTMNFATKEIPLFTKGILVKTVSVFVLVSVVGISVLTTKTSEGKSEKENDKFCNNTLVFTSNSLNSLIKEDSEKNVDIVESEFFGIQEMDTTKIQKTKTYNIKNDSAKSEVVVVGGIRKDTPVVTTQKCMSGNKPLIKKLVTVFSYYILTNDFDSTIIGKEKIEFSKMRENTKNPLLRIRDDSTFTIDYNQGLDTIVVLNPNNNEMVSQVIKKSDTFRGTGWLLPNRQYANFIVQDTLRLQYRIYLRGGNKVLFVKEATFDVRNNRPIDNNPTIKFQKAK